MKYDTPSLQWTEMKLAEKGVKLDAKEEALYFKNLQDRSQNGTSLSISIQVNASEVYVIGGTTKRPAFLAR